MSETLATLLARRGLNDFTGTRLEVVLPLTKGFININLDRAEVGPIRRADIITIDGIHVALNVQTSIPFFKDRTIEGIIYEKLEPPRFLLRLEIEQGLNFIERGLLGRFLPDGIEIDGRVITVDVRQFMERNPRLAPYIDYLHDVRLVGERDRFLLKLKYSV